MPIRAGELNRVLRFQRRTDTRNEFNELVGEWVEIAVAKGQVIALNAREFFAALQAQSERSFRVACRWSALLAEIRTTDRVLIDGRIHDIQATSDPTGRRREIEFVVVEHEDGAP